MQAVILACDLLAYVTLAMVTYTRYDPLSAHAQDRGDTKLLQSLKIRCQPSINIAGTMKA